MDKTQSELIGKPGSEDLMKVGEVCYPKWQFDQFCESGYFPKYIVKAGWKPTHREQWVWKSRRSRFYPFDEELVKDGFEIVPMES